MGAGINLIPLEIYKVLGLGELRTTFSRLLMADLSVKEPVGILHSVKVKVASFTYSVDFVILDCKVDAREMVILGRPFLSIGFC